MRYEVRLTMDAAVDLEEIYEYVAVHDSPKRADSLLSKIESSFDGLEQNPLRGTYPKELVSLGIREFRQVYFKPYRVIYKLADDVVFIVLIADGRRDMRTLLERRLLRT